MGRLFHSLALLILFACSFNTRAKAQSYIINTVAGTGTAGYLGDGGAATSARLYDPYGVATDAAGNLYIADYYNYRVRKVSTGGIITTIAGTGIQGFGGDGGAAISAQVDSPPGVAADTAGNIYIADIGNNRIRKVSTGGVITTIAGTGSYGFGGDGGVATSASLAYPTGVATDAAGNIYIADNGNHRIRKVSTSGIITTVAGSYTYGSGGDGGTATSAFLHGPTGVATDAAGNIYIADKDNHRIRKVSTSGIITTIAGTGSYGLGGDGGAATSAMLAYPYGVATDVAGNLYIADYYNNRIRKVSTGGIITTIAGTSTSGSGGNGGVATSAQLSGPTGVATDAAGNLYIADKDNKRIRKLSLNNIGLAFSGGNNYVQGTATIGITGAQPRTVEMWVKLNAGALTNGVNNFLFSSGGFSGSAQGFGLYANNGALYLSIGNFAVSTFYAIDGAWHHIAQVYNGVSILLYVDGALVYTYTPGYSLASANSVLYLGSSYGNSQYLGGTLDEVRLWNRALCQAEIQNNMNGELPSPSVQANLITYYTFDQGIAAGINTSNTTLIDGSGNGNSGTLNNFSLTGTTSNYVAGAPAITGNATQYAPTALGNYSDNVTRTISGTTAYTGCAPIASIAPGTLTGSVTAKVTYDASVQTYNTIPYVQRHYDIEPATTQNSATASITLYFTQAEFAAYNAAPNHGLSLPTTTADNTNAANLRITQYHGVPTGGNAPANYPATWGGTGNAHISITPTSIIYNSVAVRWEVVIPVTGFSGFFATSIPSNPLPIRLESFAARALRDDDVLLRWQVANQQSDDNYLVERSADGNAFATIGTVKPTNTVDYSSHDLHPLRGRSYYRIKVTSTSGSAAYSEVRSIFIGKSGFVNVYPSPAKDYVVVENSEANTTAVITDMQGRALMSFAVVSGGKADISQLVAGVYILKTSDGYSFKITKE